MCNTNFYLLEEFSNHLKEHEEEGEKERQQVEEIIEVLEEIFSSNGYGMFQCLYCHFGAGKDCKCS